MSKKQAETEREWQTRLLDAVLPHVLFDGWSRKAMKGAAADISEDMSTFDLAFPDGATYRAVQIGNGGAAGEWRVEFHRNLTTLTHLNQDPPTKSLTFAADTAKLFPAQHVPGADHAVLDIHEGPTGSPALAHSW